MTHIAILTDSPAGLPDDLVQEYGIGVIPLHVHFGMEDYLDGVEISATEFYQRLRKGKVVPTTSAPSMGEFESFYRRLADQGAEAIICVPYGKKLGMGYDTAVSTAREMPELGIEVVDANTILMAQGFLALEAARSAQAGATVQEALERVQTLIPRVRLFILVDTLKYLQLGGRIGRAQAWLGTALQFKPLLQIPTATGEIEPLGRSRTRKRALEDLVEQMAQAVQGRPVHVAVQHGDAPQEEVAALKREIAQRFDCRELYESVVSPVVGTHTGPGTIVLAFYTDEE